MSSSVGLTAELNAVVRPLTMVMYLLRIRSLLVDVSPQRMLPNLFDVDVPKLKSHENMALDPKLADTVAGGNFVNFGSERERCLFNF